MAQAKQGDTVRVHYTGKLSDGTVFDSSAEGEPLEFTLGEGRVIPGFEQAIDGMEPGQDQEVMIQSDQAYGDWQEQLVFTVPRGQVPPSLEPFVGQRLQITRGGQAMPVVVQSLDENSITLDANHPLAGKDLIFSLTLVEIV